MTAAAAAADYPAATEATANQRGKFAMLATPQHGGGGRRCDRRASTSQEECHHQSSVTRPRPPSLSRAPPASSSASASPRPVSVLLSIVLVVAASLAIVPTPALASCSKSTRVISTWSGTSDDCNDAHHEHAQEAHRALQTDGPDPPSYGTLVAYSLLLSVLGWAAILHPYVFVRKFSAKVARYVDEGVRVPGRIVSMRRGRVFNPLRFCLPSRYNCYVTVEYEQPLGGGASGAASGGGSGSFGGGKIRKELAIDERALQLLVDRHSHSIDVYTLPTHPHSGMLDGTYQGHAVSTVAKVAYALSAGALLSISFWLSLGTTTAADAIYSTAYMWKFWSVLLGHAACFILAFWVCHVVYRKRVEALLYGTIDDGTAAYGKCGVATLDAGGGKAGGDYSCAPVGGMVGTVELTGTNVSSASMNSLEGSVAAGAEGAAGAAVVAAPANGAGEEEVERPYHAMT